MSTATTVEGLFSRGRLPATITHRATGRVYEWREDLRGYYHAASDTVAAAFFVRSNPRAWRIPLPWEVATNG